MNCDHNRVVSDLETSFGDLCSVVDNYLETIDDYDCDYYVVVVVSWKEMDMLSIDVCSTAHYVEAYMFSN